jgi:hypothetical protein
MENFKLTNANQLIFVNTPENEAAELRKLIAGHLFWISSQTDTEEETQNAHISILRHFCKTFELTYTISENNAYLTPQIKPQRKTDTIIQSLKY